MDFLVLISICWGIMGVIMELTRYESEIISEQGETGKYQTKTPFHLEIIHYHQEIPDTKCN
jgi:hypothetical protein